MTMNYLTRSNSFDLFLTKNVNCSHWSRLYLCYILDPVQQIGNWLTEAMSNCLTFHRWSICYNHIDMLRIHNEPWNMHWFINAKVTTAYCFNERIRKFIDFTLLMKMGKIQMNQCEECKIASVALECPLDLLRLKRRWERIEICRNWWISVRNENLLTEYFTMKMFNSISVEQAMLWYRILSEQWFRLTFKFVHENVSCQRRYFSVTLDAQMRILVNRY